MYLNSNVKDEKSYSEWTFISVLISTTGRVGARRVGDVEGVRQSTGNWQRDPNMKWKRRVIVRQLNLSEIKQSVETRMVIGEMEMQTFMEESKKKPEPVRSPQMHHHHHHGQADKKKKKQKKQQQTHSYSTRSVRESGRGYAGHDSEVSTRGTFENISHSLCLFSSLSLLFLFTSLLF